MKNNIAYILLILGEAKASKGYSNVQIAEKAGCCARTVRNILKGIGKKPRFRSAIAKALGTKTVLKGLI